MFHTCSPIQYLGSPSARVRRLLVGALTLLGLAAGGSAGAASEVLYYFVDDRGIPHFSNVPADKRYRPFARVSVAPHSPAFDDGSEPVPYEADPVPTDESVQTEMVEEHLPVDVQEH